MFFCHSAVFFHQLINGVIHVHFPKLSIIELSLYWNLVFLLLNDFNSQIMHWQWLCFSLLLLIIIKLLMPYLVFSSITKILVHVILIILIFILMLFIVIVFQIYFFFYLCVFLIIWFWLYLCHVWLYFRSLEVLNLEEVINVIIIIYLLLSWIRT
jgi:hypothetical protein